MQCESESDGERQSESESPSESESESESECKSESETESEGESASQSESERGAQRRENFAEQHFAMLDGVTCFHCYLARAARRKNLQRSTRSPVFSNIWKCWGHTGSALMEKKRRWSDSFAENTMVERRQACKKHFSVFFLQKPDYRPYIFSLHKTAHFLIKHCIFSARGKFFGPGPRGKIFGDPPSTIIIA